MVGNILKKLLLVLFALACIAAISPNSGYDAQQFRKYWYQGKAELTRYSLEQARYGEIHKGESVLIFVTEPFLTDKQVKLEHGKSPNSTSVLKLNFTRKFYTGIYPYSVMTSTFSPVDYQKYRTLKITSSSQEWCGNTFMQLNFNNGNYKAEVRSYFQDEGDQDVILKTDWLEDELWTRIRIAPGTLPVGSIQIVPALQFVRLWHSGVQPQQATATLTDSGKFFSYTLDYPQLKRKVMIQFEKEFPYAIVKWEETQPGGFGDSPLLTTRAVKTNSLQLDYWNKHGVDDAIYRKQLGLTQ